MTTATAATFELISSAFKNGARIPDQYTCAGKDTSPPLTWSNPPSATESFALICTDPDAPAGVWYHWVVFNIPKTTTQFSENASIAMSSLGKNSWNKNQYNGPCPPPGKSHRYIFTVYALNTKLNLTGEVDAETLQKNMEGHLLESATIIGTYSKP